MGIYRFSGVICWKFGCTRLSKASTAALLLLLSVRMMMHRCSHPKPLKKATLLHDYAKIAHRRIEKSLEELLALSVSDCPESLLLTI